MQPMIRRALVALVAVLAVGVIASASASAATCVKKEGSKNYQLCVAGHSIEEITSIEASTRTTSNFVLELPKSWEAQIVCTSLSNTGKFSVNGLKESVGLRYGTLTFSGCALQGALAKKCRFPAERSSISMDGKLESVEDISMAPENGSVFLEFAFGNTSPESCPKFFEGTRQVAGRYECKLQEAKAEAVEHELKCSTSTSHQLLTEGEEDVLSYTQMVSLGGTRKGDKFSIYEGA